MMVTGCGKLARKPPPTETKTENENEAPAALGSAPASVPPSFNATPVAAYADASDFDGNSPFEQAQKYAANGQLWMARLVLEKEALSPSGTSDEVVLLARICGDQGDTACMDACTRKLGHAVKTDGGTFSTTGKGGAGGRATDSPEVVQLGRLRDMVLKKQYGPVRQALEPKVLDGSASPEEIRLLKVVCGKQNDRMCVALCDAKLR
ncbi:hypothetical protein [Labilithrix luteola]|uniref:hypothetical protein n=1 Tax=Labilithrix luteola TaxID=1391654 RepID=UPI0011BA9123|nr:hypothetical protein [Labilithrix luteola]